MQHVPVQFFQAQINKLQQKGPQYSKVIKGMKTKIRTVKGEFIWDSHGVIYKKW